MITIKLCLFAHQPAFKDSKLAAPEKKRELQAILLFLKQHQAALTADTLPELHFLKMRVKRLDGQVEMIDALIARLQGAALSKEDDLAMKMSRCAISNDSLLPFYVQLYRLKCPHIMTKLEQRRPANMDDATLLQTARVCELVEKFEIEKKFDEFLKVLDKQGIDTIKLRGMKHGFPPFPREVEHFIRSFLNDASTTIEDARINLENHISQNGLSPIPIMMKGEQLINITRLALACLIGDEPYVKRFLEVGVSPCDADNQGYTAAHFAAMVSNVQVLFLLYLHGAKFDAKTRSGATMYDLLSARGYAKAHDVRTVQTDGGIKTSTRESLYTPGALMGLWASFVQDDDSTHPLVTKKVLSDFTEIKEGKKPFDSPIGIRRCPNGHPLAGQWEAYAKRSVEAGEIVDEYTGIVQCNSTFNDGTYVSHLTDHIAINAKEQGSFAELINHGPPNCICITVIYRGLPRKVMVAVRKIEKGETLYSNYGSKYFREANRQFKELAPSAVEKFVRETANLTSFDYGLQADANEWLKTHSVIERGKLVGYAEPITSFHDEAVRCGILIGMHTHNMLVYLLQFPDYLIELVKTKRLAKERVVDFHTVFSKLPSYASSGTNTAALIQAL